MVFSNTAILTNASIISFLKKNGINALGQILWYGEDSCMEPLPMVADRRYHFYPLNFKQRNKRFFIILLHAPMGFCFLYGLSRYYPAYFWHESRANLFSVEIDLFFGYLNPSEIKIEPVGCHES
jgi:hypothetical protein